MSFCSIFYFTSYCDQPGQKRDMPVGALMESGLIRRSEGSARLKQGVIPRCGNKVGVGVKALVDLRKRLSVEEA